MKKTTAWIVSFAIILSSVFCMALTAMATNEDTSVGKTIHDEDTTISYMILPELNGAKRVKITSIQYMTGEQILPENIIYNGEIYLVVAIDDGVFDIYQPDDENPLTALSISKHIETIGANAFSGCTSLTDITFNNGVTYQIQIDDTAFSGLNNLTIHADENNKTVKEFCAKNNITFVADNSTPPETETTTQPEEESTTQTTAETTTQPEEESTTQTTAETTTQSEEESTTQTTAETTTTPASNPPTTAPAPPETTAKTTSAKQTVKLSLKKVTVKKSAKKLVLQATLKIDGKAVKGKKVTFKFNGKKYTAKTNKKGIAKVTVKKSVLKKLKKGKKITYSVKYDKKTVKKTVKVK